jgi:predicted nucleotidyltransferase
MRIDSKEKIADVATLKVRDFLRRVNNTDEWEDGFVVHRLKISPKKANRLVNELNRRGYIEPIRIYRQKQYYRKTLKGSTLGLASAAKPVTRKTANRIFSEFMDRVRQVNSDSSYLVKVQKVLVFGSYLTDAIRINDIDVAVELTWKENHPMVLNEEDKAQLALNLSIMAEDKGKKFSSFLDRLEWPEHEVRLFLKSRSRTLSIHSIHDEILNRVKYRVFFQNNKVR